MSSIYAEQENKLHLPHQLLSLKKSLRDIDIPSRKLLIRRAATTHDGASDMFSDKTILQKYLTHGNNAFDSDDGDPYSSNHFRMFEFKVRLCTRTRSHDWTECPFAHPGEKARRRDPSQFDYSWAICSEYRRGGSCSRGDACEFSHGVFECWLHPARYRTEPCKDGTNCKRKVCFFAHTPQQLRVLPLDMSSCNNNKNKNKSKSKCCLLCPHCYSSTCSPTSTLFGVSHFSSPPLSPSPSSSLSPTLFRFVGHDNHRILHHNHRGVDVLNDLVSSLEGLSFGEASPVSASKPLNLPWLDVSLPCEDQQQQQQQCVLSLSDSASFKCEDQDDYHYHQQQQQQQQKKQFFLSPTIKSNSGRFISNGEYSSGGKLLWEEKKVVNDDVTPAALDLGWVNDLLM